MVFKRSSVFLVVIALSFFSGAAWGNGSINKTEKRDLIIEKAAPLEANKKTALVKVEIARTETEQRQGLMFRKELAEGAGMLFVFEKEDFVSFWMKNTFIPLSIAFIATDGRIVEIRDMEAESLVSVRSSRSVRYALEVPQGWFDRAGVRAGDKLILGEL